MNFRPSLFFALTVILSASAFAQSKINPNLLSFRTDTSNVSSSGIASVGSKTSAAAMMVLEQDAFQRINAERGTAGLATLTWSEKIAKVARLHSQNMADYNFFSHKGVDGLMVDDRADQLGMGKWQAIGENIAFMQGYQNPATVAVEKWLLSASHRNNLMGEQWSESAIGVAMTADGKCYFTQVFLLKK